MDAVQESSNSDAHLNKWKCYKTNTVTALEFLLSCCTCEPLQVLQLPQILHVFIFIHSFIHLAVCLTTGPKPLPKRPLHIVRSRASSFKWEYPLLSLRSSSSFLRPLPRLPVTSIPPFIFPSITRCRRQFLRKMWPIQLAFRLLTSCRIFLCSLTLSNKKVKIKVKYPRYRPCCGPEVG